MSELDPRQERYLWDPEDTPDLELRRLEILLRPLGHDGGMDATAPGAGPAGLPRGHLLWLPWLGAAAAVAALLFAVLRSGGGTGVVPDPGPDTLVAGAEIRVDEGDRREFRFGDSGELLVSSGSELTVLSVDPGMCSVRLVSGRVVVRQPQAGTQLVIDTTGGRIARFSSELKGVVGAPEDSLVYQASVDASGTTELWVQSGLASLEAAGRIAYAPGMRLRSTADAGPELPYLDDDPQLRNLVAMLEAGKFSMKTKDMREAVHMAIEAIEPRASLTWLHIVLDLRRSLAIRGGVFDALVDFFEMPIGGEFERLRAGDEDAASAWVQHLAPHWR